MAQSDLNATSATSSSTIRASLKQHAPAYVLAVVLIALAFALRSTMVAPLGNQALYLFLVPPVLLVGVTSGLGPGLFTTVACLLIHLCVTGEIAVLAQPESSEFLGVTSRALTFAVLGIGIAWFSERLRETRNQAAAREAHLESILATVPEAMIVIDERGAMQSFSSAAERLFGYEARE